MKVKLLGIKGSWREVADAARTTVGKEAGQGEPSSSWKRRILLAEHSPIRELSIRWIWLGLKSWISVHFVRHHNGIQPYVKSQRPDRTGSRDNRDDVPQGALVNHQSTANAQAIINISRKRLCHQAQPETREAWQAFLETIREPEPELYGVCVPECVYRGFCPEMNPCGRWEDKPEVFRDALKKYREGSR